ncbi:virulence factor SrfC family protein [Xanthobacteraceae bacterium A53D]
MQNNWHSECGKLFDAAKQAVVWINDAGNEKVVGPERPSVEKGLRRLVTEVGKLDRSIDRPSCAGVFGPSQAGKSYLISVLAGGTASSLQARFAGIPEPLDFLQEINPGGERESTGVVTRFSCRERTAPAGFPVCLRLLSEVDIIKILGNSYFLDGDPKKALLPEPEEMRAAVAQAQSRRRPTRPEDSRLTVEDLWDVQEYFERTFEGKRGLDALRGLWDDLADLVPCLTLADRAELLSFLWGRLAQFTGVYRELVGALARLGFADDAFCPMDALVPRTASIIDVQTLDGLGRPGQPELSIRSATGAPVSLPRPIVTALVAELHITMTARPWPFLEHTDLLDFPGARGRQALDLQEFLADERKSPLRETFLRGKVAYLFDRYVAEQELTCMLLCIKPSTQEVTDLPDMIDRWVSLTHGATPDKRRGKAVSLFLVLTMFDAHFIEKAGEERADPGERFKGRMFASIEGFLAKVHEWPTRWTPDGAFTNVYWFRNPNYPAESIIEYDGNRREVQIRADRADYIDRLRAGYLAVPSVQRFFRDPGRAFDEGLRPNDGGVSYLAEQLEPVCRPQVKAGQIRARLETLRGQFLDLVARFHVSTDVETRLNERRQVAQQILAYVQHLGGQKRFADLLAAMVCSEHLFSDVLYSAYTRRSAERPADAAPPAAPAGLPPLPGAGGFAGGLPPIPGLAPIPGLPPLPGQGGASMAPPAVPSAPPAPRGNSVHHLLARAAVAFWMNGLRGASETDALGQFFPGQPKLAGELVNEMCAAARRTNLEAAVLAAIERLSGNVGESIDVALEKAAFASSTVINGFVTRFHFEALPPEERPEAPTPTGGKVRIFTRPPAANSAEELALERSHPDYDALLFWMFGFHALVEENATSVDGLDIDIARNAALRAILDRVQAIGSPAHYPQA